MEEIDHGNSFSRTRPLQSGRQNSHNHRSWIRYTPVPHTCLSSHRNSSWQLTSTPQGINLAFASLLLHCKCNVVLADLTLRSEAEQLVAQYSDPNKSPRAVFVKTDVTSWPELENMFTVAEREFSAVDIVCPGAGVYEPEWSSFWHPPGSAGSKDAPGAGHFAQLDINLTHPIRVTQLALSHWQHPPPSSSFPATTAQQEQQRKASPANPKRIVHLGSIAGYMPVFNAPLYGACKFGVHGLVRCLAPLEAQLGIRVTAVAPGVVRTPLWEENADKMAFLDPERDGWITPDEVAVAMLRCVEEEGLVGGTILEVGKGHTRVVGYLNDPGPSMDPKDGIAARNSHVGHDQVWKWLEDRKVWGRPEDQYV